MNIAKFLRTQFYKASPVAASSSSSRVTNAGIVRDKVTCSKLNNRSTRATCEIRSKLTIKTPERRHVCVSGGKKCSFFGKFGVLCFVETPVLKFTLLPYNRRAFLIFSGVTKSKHQLEMG